MPEYTYKPCTHKECWMIKDGGHCFGFGCNNYTGKKPVKFDPPILKGSMIMCGFNADNKNKEPRQWRAQ